jgi:hypothetical protein
MCSFCGSFLSRWLALLIKREASPTINLVSPEPVQPRTASLGLLLILEIHLKIVLLDGIAAGAVTPTLPGTRKETYAASNTRKPAASYRARCISEGIVPTKNKHLFQLLFHQRMPRGCQQRLGTSTVIQRARRRCKERGVAIASSRNRNR